MQTAVERADVRSRFLRSQFHAVLSELRVDIAEAMQALRFHGRMAQFLTNPVESLSRVCEALAGGEEAAGREA